MLEQYLLVPEYSYIFILAMTQPAQPVPQNCVRTENKAPALFPENSSFTEPQLDKGIPLQSPCRLTTKNEYIWPMYFSWCETWSTCLKALHGSHVSVAKFSSLSGCGMWLPIARQSDYIAPTTACHKVIEDTCYPLLDIGVR